MSPFDRIRSIIANPATGPEDDASAEVRRLLIRATRNAHPAAADLISTEIDAFNEDFALLVVSAAVAGAPPLPELQDRLRDRLAIIKRLAEDPSASLN